MQAWIYVTWIAVALGIIAGAADLAADFLADTRFGYCTQGVFLSRKLCCANYFTENCVDWVEWDQAFSVDNVVMQYITNYLVYIITSISFAVIAAWFVKSLARWAAGSGIAEVKTILGGFVIHSFLSWQTLLVKVPGLVSFTNDEFVKKLKNLSRT
jgi:chloride channel 3/4/5